MTPDQKIDVLKLVYTEEGQNLRFETTTAQRLMTYFVTVELALGAWIVSAGLLEASARWAIFLFNVAFGACIVILIVLNYQRRLEVVIPMRRALTALGLAEPGVFLAGEAIHAWKLKSSWRNWYIALITLFCTAQALPLFVLSNSSAA